MRLADDWWVTALIFAGVYAITVLRDIRHELRTMRMFMAKELLRQRGETDF